MQEAVEGRAHVDIHLAVGRASQVHAGHQHADGQLASFFRPLGTQLIAHALVFGSLQNELQGGCLQMILHLHAHIKIDRPGRLPVTTDRGTHPFHGGQADGRIQDRTIPLHITARLDGERFQGDDRHGILEGTARQGVASVEQHVTLGCVLERQVATPL